jgi:prepilin-type N-terminal cleavage/methylation domain-containing protein
MGRLKHCLGFTIVEMAAVIVILGVLASVGVVSLGLLGRVELKVASEKLRSDLAKAQLIAVSESSRSRLLVRSGSGYVVQKEACDPPVPSCSIWETVTNPSTAQPFVVGLKAGVFLAPSEIRFNSWGIPVDLGDAAVSNSVQFILTRKDLLSTVSVAPVTGHTTFELGR